MYWSADQRWRTIYCREISRAIDSGWNGSEEMLTNLSAVRIPISEIRSNVRSTKYFPHFPVPIDWNDQEKEFIAFARSDDSSVVSIFSPVIGE